MFEFSTSVNPFTHSPRLRGALGASQIDPVDLPVIDVSALSGTDEFAIRETAQIVGRAARSNGFLYVKGHGIPDKLISDVYKQAEAFFSLSEDKKRRMEVGSVRHHRGFVPLTDRGLYSDETGPRQYEAFDMGLEVDKRDPAAVGSFLLGPNLWPPLPKFKRTLSDYYGAISRLAGQLCMAFECDLGLERGFFAARMRKPTSQLRLIHYIENNSPVNFGDVNMGAHTDYECFTILHQSTNGLQVMNLDNQWVEAPPIPGTFVINIGDMLEAWTNGVYTSTLHRVVNHGAERYSIPFFVAADQETNVEPLPQFVSADRPSAYEPLVAGDHLLSQMARDFSYIRARIEQGQMPAWLNVPGTESLFERRQGKLPRTRGSRSMLGSKTSQHLLVA